MVLEGARKGRSPTPELTSTTASSPSAAYAELTLESEPSGNMSGLDDHKTRNTNTADDLAFRNEVSRPGLLDGASSPVTKRPASDMEETIDLIESENVTMKGNRSPKLLPMATSDCIQSSSEPEGLRGNDEALHQRGTVMNALAYEKTSSTQNASASPWSEDKKGTMFRGAYSTPQSGLSSDSSTGVNEASLTSSASSTTSGDIPAIDDQIDQVMQLVLKPLKEGQKGFIISKAWLSRVLSRGSKPEYSEPYGKKAKEGPIGPVDNTGINLITDPSVGTFKDEAGEPYIPLRPGMQLSEDFEILPQEAWNLIIKWYGLAKGSPIITRYCHDTSTSETMENMQFELHPPIFTILKLPDRSEVLTTKLLQEGMTKPIKILASRHELYRDFLRRVKMVANIELKTKIRIWRILGGLGADTRAGMITPAQSRSNSPAPSVMMPVDAGDRLVLDVSTFADLQLGSQRELIEANDETANQNYNGHSTLDIVGLRQDEVIVVEEQIGGPAGGEWVSDALNRPGKANGGATSATKSGSTGAQDGPKPRGIMGSRAASPAPVGMMTRGRQQKNGRTRGTVGLNNLGNTCYMNSALQCIRSVEELTQYFLLDKYKKDLNPSNPLSHNGMVANAYALLLKEMFSPNVTSSFAPRNFKNVVGKYGPSFSGYQQQDSQEFLLFLLDGLQEDLSRIHKKPYIEKPDSTDEMVNDPVALRAMADKCWDIYQARSDSVITDLFAGMYKSTVVCPVCDKVSIIFDPFNNLTLQLPIENLWSRVVYWFPLHSRPIKVGVDIDKNASFMALKEYVAEKVGVDPKKTVVAEIYKSRIYKMFDDKKTIGEERIAENDQIAIFELEHQPSNYPPPKKKVQKYKSSYYYHNSDEEEDVPNGESPLAAKMLVALFNRQVRDGHPRYQQRAVFGVPSYVIITREEANDYDAILRKVLAKVDTMTTMDFLKDDTDSGNDSAPEDSDTVLMNNDDGESSSDSRFQAKSLASEDGLIDISMRDDGGARQPAHQLHPPLPGIKHKRPPKMLRPGEFITPEVRNLFEMKYFTSQSELIPTGWSTIQDENREYPTIASRLPDREGTRRRGSKGKIARRIQRLGSASSSEADVGDADPAEPIPTQQNSYDSDSDGLPDVEQVTRAPASFSRFNYATRQNRKGLITYGRKDKNAPYNRSCEELEPDTVDNPLIRLGEAIVLDWTPEAYDAFFLGHESNGDTGLRGVSTWDDIPTMPDPDLEQKRRLRLNRKRNGISLEDCLDEFGKAEVLSENDAWYCPRCKEHRRASKTLELWKAPDILVIHLKRFSAQGRNLRDKLDVLVDFPVEGLDLSSRVAMHEDGKNPIYDLFAVDNHYGGLGGGHYTAFARNDTDKNWYEYNDSSVSRRANPQVVVTAAAYLLFYRRRADHPLGGPFFEKIINAANISGSQSEAASRATSPAGEGRRLDSSSHNGLSSALAGAEVTHQVGGGGLAAVGTAVQIRTGVDDELPSYSASAIQPTLEGMELDEEDEAIADLHSDTFNVSRYSVPNWSFPALESNEDGELAGITHRIPMPSGSEGDDEDLFDDESNKANSPSEDGRRMAEFADDEGTTSGAFGPYRSGGTPVQDVPPPMEDYDTDPAVAEVRLTDGEEMGKLD